MINFTKLHHTVADLYNFFPRYISNDGFAFPPLKVAFAITRKCNQKCEMCYMGPQTDVTEDEKDFSERGLTIKDFALFIRQIPGYCLVSFTGGEPFLKNDFLEIIEVASCHHKVLFLTNATLMDEERVKRLIKISSRNLWGAGLFLLNISIHGLEERHDAITNVKGSFLKTTENTRILQYYKKKKGNKYPLLNLTAVIMQRNVQDLTEIFKLAETLRVDSCTFQVFNIQFSPQRLCIKKENEVIPRFDSLNPIDFPYIGTLGNELAKVKQISLGSKVKLRFLPDIPISEIIKHYSNTQDASEYACYSPWVSFNVGPQGDISPCCCYNYKMGNIKEGSFKKTWNGLEFRKFRCKLKHEGIFPACVGCSFVIHKRKH